MDQHSAVQESRDRSEIVGGTEGSPGTELAGCIYGTGCLLSIVGVIGLAFGLIAIDDIKFEQAFDDVVKWNLIIIAVAIASIILVGVTTFLAYVGLRGFKRPRGFLSHHNADESIADAVCSMLADINLSVEYIPFRAARHDQVIEETQKRLRKSTFLLVLPGPGGTFADSEIYAATALRKPVIFLSKAEDLSWPDTAYTGYPAFSLKCLREEGMVPLKAFVEFLCGYWRQAMVNLRRGSSEVISRIAYPAIFIFVLFRFFDGLFFFFPGFALKAQTLLLIMNLGIWNTAVAVGCFMVVRDRMKTADVARQKIITGDITHDRLTEIFGRLDQDKGILQCLDTLSRAGRSTSS